MAAYAEKCHPKMKWLETVEAQEDNNLSFNQATTLINKYGDELKGIFGMTSVATPASAEAVTQANKCGKVAVVGLATPNAMKPYVEKADCVKSVVLWNPVDLGYAAACAARRCRRHAAARRHLGEGRQARRRSRSSTARKSCSARLRVHQGQHRPVRLLSLAHLASFGAALRGGTFILPHGEMGLAASGRLTFFVTLQLCDKTPGWKTCISELISARLASSRS
jgi:hypothetical protein